MKHIAFAVVAAAALAIIGPRIAQDNPQPEQTAATHELFAPSDYRAAPRNHAKPAHEWTNAKETEGVRQ